MFPLHCSYFPSLTVYDMFCDKMVKHANSLLLLENPPKKSCSPLSSAACRSRFLSKANLAHVCRPRL